MTKTMCKQLCKLTLYTLLCLPLSAVAATSSQLWDGLLNGESVALMRHALAPGNGDPDNFVIGDCSTQRNLSQEGRIQARRIGEMFRANSILRADVFSSQWCRCVETSIELGFSEPTALPLLNSFYQNRSTASVQTTDLHQWVKARLENNRKDTILPAILVTHQVNITGLTSVYPTSGEVVFVGIENGQVVTLGSIEP